MSDKIKDDSFKWGIEQEQPADDMQVMDEKGLEMVSGGVELEGESHEEDYYDRSPGRAKKDAGKLYSLNSSS